MNTVGQTDGTFAAHLQELLDARRAAALLQSNSFGRTEKRKQKQIYSSNRWQRRAAFEQELNRAALLHMARLADLQHVQRIELLAALGGGARGDVGRVAECGVARAGRLSALEVLPAAQDRPYGGLH